LVKLLYIWIKLFILETVHKRHLHCQGGGGFVQCGHFADKDRGSYSDADLRTFGEKNTKFFEICDVSAQRVRTFFGQGKSIFRDLVRIAGSSAINHMTIS